MMLLAGISFYACEESALNGEDPALPDTGKDPNNNVQRTLNGSDFSLDEVRTMLMDLGIGGPVAPFIASGSTSGRSEGQRSILRAKSTGSGNARTENEVCYSETYTEYEDGSYVWEIDFGSGCELDDMDLTGKITGKGIFTENSFTDTITYIDFGSTDFAMNGTEIISGTWSMPEFWDEEFAYDSTGDGEEVWDLIESTYEFYSNLEVTFIEDDISYSGTWISEGKESMDGNGWTIEVLHDVAEFDNGERFEVEVTVPLYMDYSCEDAYFAIFVSGVEIETWTYEGESGEEIIDYGDGECDTLAEITADGETEIVDLADEWY